MTPVANPHEAIERMLQEKKLSSKINYDVLKNLGKDLVRYNLLLNVVFYFFINSISFLLEKNMTSRDKDQSIFKPFLFTHV